MRLNRSSQSHDVADHDPQSAQHQRAGEHRTIPDPRRAEPARQPDPPLTHSRRPRLRILGLSLLALAAVVTLVYFTQTGSHPHKDPASPDSDRPASIAPSHSETAAHPTDLLPSEAQPPPPIPEWHDEGKWIRVGNLLCLKEAREIAYAFVPAVVQQARTGLNIGDWDLPSEEQLATLRPLLDAGILAQKPGDLIWTNRMSDGLAASACVYTPGAPFQCADYTPESHAYARLVHIAD